MVILSFPTGVPGCLRMVLDLFTIIWGFKTWKTYRNWSRFHGKTLQIPFRVSKLHVSSIFQDSGQLNIRCISGQNYLCCSFLVKNSTFHQNSTLFCSFDNNGKFWWEMHLIWLFRDTQLRFQAACALVIIILRILSAEQDEVSTLSWSVR